MPRASIDRFADRRFRPALLAAAVALTCGAPVLHAQPSSAASAGAERSYDIGTQPLGATLTRIAAESGQPISIQSDLVRGLVAPAVVGRFTGEQAATRALDGSGLMLTRTGSGALTVQPGGGAATTAPPATAPSTTSTSGAVEPNSVRSLETIHVTADQLNATTENSGSYTTGGITIGKATRALKDTPQSVSVITRYRLDDQNMRSLDDALLNSPGITAEMQSSTERNFYSRGFLIDTIQYDGVPTERGSGFSTSPDLSGYDRVEILRGPAGLFNGAGNPGGTVNLVRKRPLREQQFIGQARVGSWNYKRADADLSVPLNEGGSVRARMVTAYEDRDYFYDYADAKKSVFYGIVEADLGSRTTLGLGVNYERNKSVPFYTGLPRYTNGQDLRLSRSSYTNGGWSTSDIKNTTVFADLNHNFDDNWRLKASVSSMREDNNEFTGAGFGAVNPVTGLGFAVSGFDQHLVGTQVAADVNLTGSFGAMGRHHDVLVGANYLKRDYDVDSQAYASVPANPFTFDPSNYLTRPTAFARAASATTQTREQTGVYGSLRLALSDRTKFAFGGRVSSWETETVNRVTGLNSVQPYQENGNFTSYGALSYDLTPEWMTYASYAEIFRSQANLFTAAGERLDPVTGSNAELGLKGALFGGNMNASVALFRTLESNRSQVDPNNPQPCAASPNGTAACYVAEGKVRSQGLDAELTGAITPNWQMAAGYTFNQTKYLRDRTATGLASTNENQPLSTFTPRHIVRLWTAYRLPGAASKWTLAGGVNLQSETYKTGGTLRVEQASYAVWSARVNYQISRNVSAALNVTNIFDKKYYRTIGTNGGNWYGEPLNVMASMQVLF